MADRRRSQNFQHLPHYLTDPVWNSVESASREKAESVLLRHCWKLGLRCPSEQTFAVLHNVLTLASRQRHVEMSLFEKYKSLGQLKTAWKKYKGLMRAEDHQYTTYMESLPQSPPDLPAEYQLQAFSEHDRIPCSHSVLHSLMDKKILMVTNQDSNHRSSSLT